VAEPGKMKKKKKEGGWHRPWSFLTGACSVAKGKREERGYVALRTEGEEEELCISVSSEVVIKKGKKREERGRLGGKKVGGKGEEKEIPLSLFFLYSRARGKG